MKFFKRYSPEEPKALVSEPTHKNGAAWDEFIPQALKKPLVVMESTPIPEVFLKNPKPYRGAVAFKVSQKMMRNNTENYIHLSLLGARAQAKSQLWVEFVRTCYEVGIPVDANANLRLG